jgi:RNA polymerase sigma-70 factor (family 1)
MSKAPLSDHDLWIAIKDDDVAAYNKLFDRYWVKLYKLAISYLKDQESSTEIVHDIFVTVWQRRKELEINTFSAYLLTAARYQVYNKIKSAKLSIAYIADYSENDHPTDLNLGAARIEQTEFQHQIDGYLSQLPKRCGEIFQLSRTEHLSNEEIAQRLGISKRSVENQIALALKHLKLHVKYIATLIIFLTIS